MEVGNEVGMTPWSLLAIPLCLGLMVLLLMGITWFENRMLSPRSLIQYTAKSRHVGPDTVELFITAQSEALLKSQDLRPPKRPQATPAPTRP
ncbi:MAG: hypothetical protein ABR540_05045 [Acidimicrobiales bacterium]